MNAPDVGLGAPKYKVLLLRRADGTFAFDTCSPTLERAVLRAARKGETFRQARDRLHAAGWTIWLFRYDRQEDMFRTFRTLQYPTMSTGVLDEAAQAPKTAAEALKTASLMDYDPLGPRMVRWVCTTILEPIGRYAVNTLHRWGIRWEWK